MIPFITCTLFGGIPEVFKLQQGTVVLDKKRTEVLMEVTLRWFIDEDPGQEGGALGLSPSLKRGDSFQS